MNVDVGIEGLIGVGKSTATKAVETRFGAQCFFEPVETNPWLKRFYKDPKRFGYPMQKYCFDNRMLMHQEAEEHKGLSVLDRTMFGDWVFSRSNYRCENMSEAQMCAYEANRIVTLKQQKPLDIIFYLRASPEKCLERIKKRGRDCEKDITVEYLQILYEEYDFVLEWIRKNYPMTRIVDIEWTDEFEQNTEVLLEHLEKVAYPRGGNESPDLASSGGSVEKVEKTEIELK